jgi:ABC-type Zn uptake system ZnuABC Zn-binding protein ZnuA
MSASESELGLLHKAVARYLATKIESGEVSASDISNAIKLLKDNNITCAPAEGDDLTKLQAALNTASSPMKADATDLSAALEQLDFSSGQVN